MLGECDQLIRTSKDNSATVTQAVSDLARQISRLTSSVRPPAAAAAADDSGSSFCGTGEDILAACNMDFPPTGDIRTLDVSYRLKSPKTSGGDPSARHCCPTTSFLSSEPHFHSPESLRSSSSHTSSEESCVVSSGCLHSSCRGLHTSCLSQTDCSSCFCFFHCLSRCGSLSSSSWSEGSS